MHPREETGFISMSRRAGLGCKPGCASVTGGSHLCGQVQVRDLGVESCGRSIQSVPLLAFRKISKGCSKEGKGFVYAHKYPC